jgi:hypothetical protein
MHIRWVAIKISARITAANNPAVVVDKHSKEARDTSNWISSSTDENTRARCSKIIQNDKNTQEDQMMQSLSLHMIAVATRPKPKQQTTAMKTIEAVDQILTYGTPEIPAVFYQANGSYFDILDWEFDATCHTNVGDGFWIILPIDCVPVAKIDLDFDGSAGQDTDFELYCQYDGL